MDNSSVITMSSIEELTISPTTNVFNVAIWFLQKQPMTHKKMQNLCYYAQAWHLALLNRPLFGEEIQAWIHGPVIPKLYAKYAGYDWWEEISVKNENIIPSFPKNTIEVLNAVWNTYHNLDDEQLEALTHSEKPWQEARNGISPLEPSENVISCKSMRDFYKKLYQDSQND